MPDSNTGDASETQGELPERIVQAVAADADVSPTDLEPLHDVLDPDALANLFEPSRTAPRPTGWVTFHYSGYEVVAHADGHVELTELDE